MPPGGFRCKSSCNGIFFTVLIGIVLTILGFALEDSILVLFGVTDGCYAYAKDYMDIILLGIPFYVFASAMNGPIRADGAPGYAMFATVIGAILNLIGDPVAIFVLDLGVKGAAAATVIGQVVSCLVTLAYFRRPKLFRLAKADFRPRMRLLGQTCRLSVCSLITQLSIVIIMSVANNLVGLYGPQSVYGADIPLSAIGIVMKVFAIVVSFVVGIALGGQPVVGYNFGAGNYRRVFSVCRLILLANIVVGVIAMALFELCPLAIIHLFGSESALYNEYAVLCFRIFLGGILLFCVQRASSIFLMSMGRAFASTLLSVCRDVLFFVPAIVLLAHLYGVVGMLWAAVISDILSFLLTVVLMLREYRRIRKLETADARQAVPAA